MTDVAQPTVSDVLGADRRRRRWPWVVVGVLMIGLLVVAARVTGFRQPPSPVTYRTAAAALGDVAVTVTATGALESQTQVHVGTEVSGIVDRVLVDFNSVVRRGDLLATVNTEKLRAQADQLRASVRVAVARTQQVEATLTEVQAQLARLQSVRELSGGRVPSQQEYDTAQGAAARAVADLASAEAQVAQSEANLAVVETDLRRAEIRSPINGIVLDRQVDPGQTVAAAFQTPTLFTVAGDLTRLQLVVDVDEADIGQIRIGQTAAFRVDAYPTRTFPSRVQQIRSTPRTANGVVTYRTTLGVDNGDRLLLPGMTATAEITVATATGTLLVPNAALRFVPEAQPARRVGTSLLPRPSGSAPATTVVSGGDGPGSRRVYVLDGETLREVAVEVGLSDGRMTAVHGTGLTPGTRVVVAQERQ